MTDSFYNVAWYVVLSLMFAGYALLDGFDLGVGALHLFVARDEKERATSINTIGPVWNGNEVWLLAGGGAMVVAFPHLYAASFSGFYLALMLVLWLLILRGVGIEFRHQMSVTIWREAWDFLFWLASLLLTLLFGVAVGNVLVGVPFGPEGRFQGSFAVLLNWFAILCGLLSVAVLMLHGANYLAMKTAGAIQERARRFRAVLFWVVIGLLLAVTGASFATRAGEGLANRPDFLANYRAAPVLFLFTLLGVASVVTMFLAHLRKRDRLAFLSGGGLIISILTSVAAGLFPWLLPSNSPYPGLTIYNTASSAISQKIAFFIYLVGIAIVAVYLVYVYRTWAGKVDETGSYGSH